MSQSTDCQKDTSEHEDTKMADQNQKVQLLAATQKTDSRSSSSGYPVDTGYAWVVMIGELFFFSSLMWNMEGDGEGGEFFFMWGKGEGGR